MTACYHQCDTRIPKEDAKKVWWYKSIKNRSKLSNKRTNRQANKARIRKSNNDADSINIDSNSNINTTIEPTVDR
jgi:hypothetical protein